MAITYEPIMQKEEVESHFFLQFASWEQFAKISALLVYLVRCEKCSNTLEENGEFGCLVSFTCWSLSVEGLLLRGPTPSSFLTYQGYLAGKLWEIYESTLKNLQLLQFMEIY